MSGRLVSADGVLYRMEDNEEILGLLPVEYGEGDGPALALNLVLGEATPGEDDRRLEAARRVGIARGRRSTR